VLRLGLHPAIKMGFGTLSLFVQQCRVSHQNQRHVHGKPQILLHRDTGDGWLDDDF
jgi:hypothetical protein